MYLHLSQCTLARLCVLYVITMVFYRQNRIQCWIWHLITIHHNSLLTVDSITEEVEVAREKVWSHIPRGTTNMCQTLMSPLTPHELHAAITALDTSSCPAQGGLLRQFFMECQDTVYMPLLSCLQFTFDSRCVGGLSLSFPKGVIPLHYVSGILSLLFPGPTKFQLG